MNELQCQEGYQFLREATTDDMEIIHRLERMPMGQRWAPPRVRLFRESDFLHGALPSDFLRLAPGVPVFSTQAVEALRDVLEIHGELLALICEDWGGKDYLAFNVTAVADALDVARSDVKFYRDSVRVMHVTRYAFAPERLAGISIFKLPQFVRNRVYVTDAFLQLVQDQGLTGFQFTPLWSND